MNMNNIDVNVKAVTTPPDVTVQYKTIILKKHLVDGVNTLTQEMMDANNTKYVIKYDYILGEDITVPENCILEFDGGSVKNHSIKLSGLNLKIFSVNTGVFLGSGSYISNIGNSYKCHIISKDILGFRLLSTESNVDDSNIFIELTSDNNTQIIPTINTNCVCKLENCKFLKGENAVWFNNPKEEHRYIIIDDCVFIQEDEEIINEAVVIKAVDARPTIDTNDNYIRYPYCNCTLMCKNSLFSNVGLSGQVIIDGCTFNVGNNNLHQNEVVHAEFVSSIKDSIFFSDENLEPVGELGDVIDCYTSESTVIDHCKFINLVSSNIITVKQHFGRGWVPGEHYDAPDNYPNVKMYGVTITKCAFDCPRTPYLIWGTTDSGELVTDINDIRRVGPIDIIENTFRVLNENCIRFTKPSVIRILNNTVMQKTAYSRNRGYYEIVEANTLIIKNNKELKENILDTSTFTSYIVSGRNINISDNDVFGYIKFNFTNSMIFEIVRLCNNISEVKGFSMWNLNAPLSFNDNVLVISYGNVHKYNDSLIFKQDVILGSSQTHPEHDTNIAVLYKGAVRFDALTGKPIWWTGTDWVDATGTPV